MPALLAPMVARNAAVFGLGGGKLMPVAPSGVKPVLKLDKSGVKPVLKVLGSKCEPDGPPSMAGLKGPVRSDPVAQLKGLLPSAGEVRDATPGRVWPEVAAAPVFALPLPAADAAAEGVAGAAAAGAFFEPFVSPSTLFASAEPPEVAEPTFRALARVLAGALLLRAGEAVPAALELEPVAPPSSVGDRKECSNGLGSSS